MILLDKYQLTDSLYSPGRWFDLQVIETPRAINKFIYNCGRSFVLEPIVELFKQPVENYGILQVYGEKTIVQISNEFAEVKTIDIKTTKLQKKQSHGGQSKNRIERLRQESIHNYLKLAGEKAMLAFVKNGIPIIKALLIIGPGMKKDQIQEYINIPVIIMVKSADVDDPISPLLLELIATCSSNKNATALKEIDDLLIKQPDMLVFGDEIKSDEVRIVHDNPLITQKYGGPVGIRYFAAIDADSSHFDADTNHADNSKSNRNDQTNHDNSSSQLEQDEFNFL